MSEHAYLDPLIHVAQLDHPDRIAEGSGPGRKGHP